MRKVKFNKWLPIAWDSNPMDKNAKVIYSNTTPDKEVYPNVCMLRSAGFEKDFPNEGYFHAWSSLQQSPLAIIEDNEGLLHEIPTQHVHFITSPDDIQVTGHKIDEVEIYAINKNFDINQIMKTEDM
jgi:hypothetical protein